MHVLFSSWNASFPTLLLRMFKQAGVFFLSHTGICFLGLVLLTLSLLDASDLASLVKSGLASFFSTLDIPPGAGILFLHVSTRWVWFAALGVVQTPVSL